MGQTNHVAFLAAQYVRIVSPSIIIFMWAMCYGFTMSAQGKPMYALYATAGASAVHWGLAPYLADTLNMKMKGIAISTFVHFLCRFIILRTCYSLDPKLSRCLIPLWHEDSFKGWDETFRLGFSAMLVSVAGWWAFDVFTLLASQLDTTDVAAQTILRNLGLFTYMIPVGLSSAMNFFTGQYIGKNRIDLAHKISDMVMCVSFAWSFMSMAIVWAF